MRSNCTIQDGHKEMVEFVTVVMMHFLNGSVQIMNCLFYFELYSISQDYNANKF